MKSLQQCLDEAAVAGNSLVHVLSELGEAEDSQENRKIAHAVCLAATVAVFSGMSRPLFSRMCWLAFKAVLSAKEGR